MTVAEQALLRRAMRKHRLAGMVQHSAQFLCILDEGRIAIAALATGLAQGCVDESVKYAKERYAFGRLCVGPGVLSRGGLPRPAR